MQQWGGSMWNIIRNTSMYWCLCLIPLIQYPCVGSCGSAASWQTQGQSTFFFVHLHLKAQFTYTFGFFHLHHLFFMDETKEMPLDDVLAPCYVLHHNLIFDMNLWSALGVEYFYYQYCFTRRTPGSWGEWEPIKENAGVECKTCAYTLQACLTKAMEFAK